MTTTVKVMTWNILECGLRPEMAQRVRDAGEVIAAAAPDVCMLQEIGNLDALHTLADTAGLDYQAPGLTGETTPAYEPGSVGFGVALMWRPTVITPVPGTLRLISGPNYFHGIAAVLARIGDPVDGPILQFAASHLTPWRLPRAIEAEQIAAAVTMFLRRLCLNPPVLIYRYLQAVQLKFIAQPIQNIFVLLVRI